MTDHGAPDHRCTQTACDVDWLLDPAGPDNPAWLARVKAEWDAAPSLVGQSLIGNRPTAHGRWAREFDRCRICGTTATRHHGDGRCTRCQSYWRLYGVERPSRLWEAAASA